MKGIAIQQIVLLVLAVIVLAALGYYLFTTFGTAGPKISRTNCQAALLDACSYCKNTNWDPNEEGIVTTTSCTSSLVKSITGVTDDDLSISGNQIEVNCSASNFISWCGTQGIQ